MLCKLQLWNFRFLVILLPAVYFSLLPRGHQVIVATKIRNSSRFDVNWIASRNGMVLDTREIQVTRRWEKISLQRKPEEKTSSLGHGCCFISTFRNTWLTSLSPVNQKSWVGRLLLFFCVAFFGLKVCSTIFRVIRSDREGIKES